jgi:hypothetical protein
VTSPAALAFFAGHAFQCRVIEAVPLIQELLNIKTNLGFKFDNAFLGEDVGYDLPFSRVFRPIPGVEYTSLDGNECVIELRFESTIAMRVDYA